MPLTTPALSGLPVLLLLACAHPAPARAADAWSPTAEQTAVYQALSARDTAADVCDAVEALATDPVSALTAVAEHATQPPWAAVRATHCLASRHAAASQATLTTWVADPDRRGLAILIANELDGMPEPVALSIARAGLAGPHAADLQKRLPDSAYPSLRALAQE